VTGATAAACTSTGPRAPADLRHCHDAQVLFLADPAEVPADAPVLPASRSQGVWESVQRRDGNRSARIQITETSRR